MSLTSNRMRAANRIYEQWLYLLPPGCPGEGMDFTNLHTGEANENDRNRIAYEFHPDTYDFFGDHIKEVPSLIVRFCSKSSSPIFATISGFPKWNEEKVIHPRDLRKGIRNIQNLS